MSIQTKVTKICPHILLIVKKGMVTLHYPQSKSRNFRTVESMEDLHVKFQLLVEIF